MGISEWQIGKDTINFKLENGFAVQHCYLLWISLSWVLSKFVKRRRFCTIITNDAWWGKLFGTYQHNQYAILRAVENRRWIIRSANTGISDIIDPYGNMVNEDSDKWTCFFCR